MNYKEKSSKSENGFNVFDKSEWNANDVGKEPVEPPQKENVERDCPPKPRTKRLGLWCVVLASMFAVSAVVTNFSHTTSHNQQPVSTSVGAQEILQQRWSDKLELGARLVLNDDQVSLKPVDLTFTHHNAEETTKIWIWDFAAEDGDYVQVLVDGKPVSEPFMIKNEPVSFDVSKNSVIKVIGVRDGGGGITYAFHLDALGQTYLNGTDVNQANTYTMKYEAQPE
ncbi:MAG: hypothetical protein MJY78_10715 [Fibrobacter sp.]|nr:hypothetical protein [Fibrobacter sp.]